MTKPPMPSKKRVKKILAVFDRVVSNPVKVDFFKSHVEVGLADVKRLAKMFGYKLTPIKVKKGKRK